MIKQVMGMVPTVSVVKFLQCRSTIVWKVLPGLKDTVIEVSRTFLREKRYYVKFKSYFLVN